MPSVDLGYVFIHKLAYKMWLNAVYILFWIKEFDLAESARKNCDIGNNARTEATLFRSLSGYAELYKWRPWISETSWSLVINCRFMNNLQNKRYSCHSGSTQHPQGQKMLMKGTYIFQIWKSHVYWVLLAWWLPANWWLLGTFKQLTHNMLVISHHEVTVTFYKSFVSIEKIQIGYFYFQILY